MVEIVQGATFIKEYIMEKTVQGIKFVKESVIEGTVQAPIFVYALGQVIDKHVAASTIKLCSIFHEIWKAKDIFYVKTFIERSYKALQPFDLFFESACLLDNGLFVFKEGMAIAQRYVNVRKNKPHKYMRTAELVYRLSEFVYSGVRVLPRLTNYKSIPHAKWISITAFVLSILARSKQVLQYWSDLRDIHSNEKVLKILPADADPIPTYYDIWRRNLEIVVNHKDLIQGQEIRMTTETFEYSLDDQEYDWLGTIRANMQAEGKTHFDFSNYFNQIQKGRGKYALIAIECISRAALLGMNPFCKSNNSVFLTLNGIESISTVAVAFTRNWLTNRTLA